VLPNEDACSLNGRLRFRATVTNTGAGTNAAPEYLAHSFIDRMRVEIGGSKIIDLDHYNLQQGVVQVATGGESHDLKGNRAYNSMSSVAQLDPATRETLTTFQYDIPLSLLDDSMLEHKRSLLPLFMLPRTTLTIYTASDEAATSAVGSPATYVIDNIELVMTYYTSPGIKSFFSSVPYSLAFTGTDHRLFVLPQGQTQFDLQVPSNYRSLRSLVAVARPDDIENDFAATNKNVTFDSLGGANTKWNLRVNGYSLLTTTILHYLLRYCTTYTTLPLFLGSSCGRRTSTEGICSLTNFVEFSETK
jgi:hypothetical protein